MVTAKKQRSSNPRTRKARHLFVDNELGALVPTGLGEKWQRDTLRQHLGEVRAEESLPDVRPDDTFTLLDLNFPLGSAPLKPSRDNPICIKCELCFDSQAAFLPYQGSEDPLVTVVFDSVSKSESVAGAIAAAGQPQWLAKFIATHAKVTGVPLDRVRWVPSTRCGPTRSGETQDYKVSGRWCRHFLVQDLMLHPPKVVLAVGTAALGLLSHKSDANTWTGRELTWRGWPDDWVSDPRFMLPRRKEVQPGVTLTGHPMFGPFQQTSTILYPILAPHMVAAMQSEEFSARWKEQIKRGLAMAVKPPPPKTYVLPWYEITEDPARIEEVLGYLIRNPGTVVTYDTETTGLKPWAPGAAIVFMMFRWEDKDGYPVSIGFPWNFSTSGVQPHIERLTPTVLNALYASKLSGHNLSFDILFTYGTVPGADLHRLTAAMTRDSWHMSYVRRQQRGSLGLESIAYDYVPALAGYEEEMTLLIRLHSATMDPADGLGGHYANCPRDKWDTHLKPYVMGDVEVCHQAVESLQEHLRDAKVYRIPMAHITDRGSFRRFQAPSREWVYHNIMAPSDRLLTRMMGRGQHINPAEVQFQEEFFPKEIVKYRKAMAEATPAVEAWVQRQMDTVEDFEFDLEDKTTLKTVLFDDSCLGLPVQRLTKMGQLKFGEGVDMRTLPPAELFEYAAVDKFTLNKLAADHPQVRPLQAYKKVVKLYTTYVRPVRGHFDPVVDKKRRVGDPHLCSDGKIHGRFLLCGTRSGRLSSQDPNLQQLPSDAIIKRQFVSRFGERGCLYGSDLSQIELRLMAAVSGDPGLLKAYYEGLDLHTLTASRLYKTDYEVFTKGYMEKLQAGGRADEAKKLDLKRKVAKTTNFLTGYGGGAFGLQTALANNSVYLPFEECESIIDRFFESYPVLAKYLSFYKKFIEDNAVACSVFGRIRVFEEVRGEDHKARAKALRSGCNHLIQATASDLMLICMSAIEGWMRQENLESILVSTIHDSLVVDAVKSELPKIHEIVDTVVNNMPDVLTASFGDTYDTSWMICPISGDAEVGTNYLDMAKLPKVIDWDEVGTKLVGAGS